MKPVDCSHYMYSEQFSCSLFTNNQYGVRVPFLSISVDTSLYVEHWLITVICVQIYYLCQRRRGYPVYSSCTQFCLGRESVKVSFYTLFSSSMFTQYGYSNDYWLLQSMLWYYKVLPCMATEHGTIIASFWQLSLLVLYPILSFWVLLDFSQTCGNPDCLYLHDVGSQEDSFTKDEIISAYTR